MAAFTAKIGSVDISAYVRVSPGDGLDPLGAGWENPQFNTAPFGEGQPLVNIDSQNAQLTFPLFVKDTTKDALHTTIQALMREIRYAPRPLRLEWKDSSATNSSFRDITFARINPHFNYRLSDSEWADVAVEVWCAPPFWHTATERIVATGAATGVAVTVNVASIIGDAPALLDARITTGSYVPKEGRIVGLAVLPATQYVVDIPAASFITLESSASLIGASGAAGSQYVGFFSGGTNLASTVPAPMFSVALSPASAYEGRNRVLLVTGQRFKPGIAMRGFDSTGQPIGPTVIASSPLYRGWHTVDLGVLNVTAKQGQATAVLAVQGGLLEATGYFGGSQGLAGHWAAVNRTIVLPEDTTTLTLDSRRQAVDADGFDGTSSGMLIGRTDQYGTTWATVGSGDLLISNAFSPAIGAVGIPPGSAALGCGAVLNGKFSTDLTLEADFYMLRVPSLSLAVVNAVTIGVAQGNIASAPQIGLTTAYGGASGNDILNLYGQQSKTVNLARASVPLASAATLDGTMRLRITGQTAQGALWDNTTGSLLASNTITHAAIANPGQPFIAITTASPALSIATAGAFIRDLRVMQNPSRALAARDIYHYYGPDQTAWRANSADAFQESVSFAQRGPFQSARPTAPNVVALSLPLEGAPANDIMSTEIRVRDRFTYSR